MSARGLMLGLAVGAGALIVLRPREAAAGYHGLVYDGNGGGFEYVGDGAYDSMAETISAGIDALLGVPAAPAGYSGMSAEQNVSAFLLMIREFEGTAGPLGYQTMFGGGTFSGFADHPRQRITRTVGGRPITSTAAGAYQFLSRTWDECRAAIGLPDFSPASQDAAAVFLIERRGALRDVQEGRFADAIRKTNREWASLPGSPYGQPTATLDRASAVFQSYGGTVSA